jgi:hypothetical protein
MKNSELAVVIATQILALLILVTLEVNGILGPRTFGLFCLFVMVASGFAYFRVFRRSQRRILDSTQPAVAQNRLTRSGISIRIAAIAAWLIICSWKTRGSPLAPRLVGGFFAALFLSALLFKRPGSAS